MSNWQSRYDPREDLPYGKPEEFRLNAGDRVYYRGELWTIAYRNHTGFTPEKYCNDTNAFYKLVRYEYGTNEISYYVTHDDFGSGIATDTPEFNKVEYCDTCIPTPQPGYSESYLALIGR